jgi:hypothetical protein
MKYSLSPDLIRSATIAAFLFIDVSRTKIPFWIGPTGVITSQFIKGLPDSGNPSNLLSTSWSVGKDGISFMSTIFSCAAAAGADHGCEGSYPSKPIILDDCEMFILYKSPKLRSDD